MPTLPSPPPEPAPTPLIPPDQIREVAVSFGTDAQRYDRARPSYPDAMVQRIVAASPGPEVLDVGCGTGIAARLFQAAGCRVFGVDPDERMAELARQSGMDVEVARIEDWDPAGRQFDLVTAGQAWHWVDEVAGARQAARVLRPGGRLAVFWNGFEPPEPLQQEFVAVYRRVMPDSALFRGQTPGGNAYSALATKAANGMRAAGGFGEPEEWRFEWELHYTRDEYLDLVPTTGLATRLPADILTPLLAGLGAAIDAAGGGFTTHCTTVVGTAARTG